MPRPPRDLAAWLVIIVLLAALSVMRWTRDGGDGVFPARPVAIICPFAPGGGTDLLARSLARAAEAELGVTLTVNNTTGGGGAVGMAAGLLVPPDGHTLTLVTFELVSLPVQGLVPFTHEDFDLVMRLNMDPAALAVRADFPADTVEEFLAWARARDAVTIGNSGPGSVWHLASARLAEAAHIPVRPVPFAGAAPAVTALVGGHVDAVTVSPGEVRAQVMAGQVKILAVMSDTRVALFPEVPTFSERGIELIFGTWRGLAVPRGTPAPVRERLVAAFSAALASPEMADFAATSGINLAPADSAAFRRLVATQADEVRTLMTSLGLARQ